MRFFQRLFPDHVTREALRSVSKLEQSLPEFFGPQVGFDAIKKRLREKISRNPELFRKTVQEHGNSIETVVLIVARNVVWDELASGNHMMFGTRKTMTGDGLVALFSYLSVRLEKAGVEPAAQANANLRDMIQDRFG